MRIRNSPQGYGLIHILMHWTTAVVVIGLFASGLWMTSLNYYHAWYTRAPFLHRSIGIALFALVAFRLIWRLLNKPPADEPGVPRWESMTAHTVHFVLYGLIFLICISGYLISTAEGQGIAFFGLFDVPATVSGIDKQADKAGIVHFYLAWGLIVLVSLHVLAALKHHFLDRDRTLIRMFGARAGAHDDTNDRV